MKRFAILTALAACLTGLPLAQAQPQPLQTDPGWGEDPSAVRAYVQDCVERTIEQNRTGPLSVCMDRLVRGSAADGYRGPDLSEAARAVIARPLLPLLESDNWDILGETMYWLGILGEDAALAGLDQVAETFWFAPIREVAAYNAAAIREEGRTLPQWALPWESVKLCMFGGVCAGSDMRLARGYTGPIVRAVCTTHAWRWRNHLFKGGPATRSPRPWAPLQWSAKFDREDSGYFIGTAVKARFSKLIWVPVVGEVLTVLENEPITDLMPDGEDLLVATGMNSMMTVYGRVYRVRHNRRDFQIETLADLPQHTRGLRMLDDGLYAAYSPASAIVFTNEAILGEAECLDLHPQEAWP